MSQPLNEHDTHPGGEALEPDVGAHPVQGHPAPVGKNSRVTAGDVDLITPRQFTRQEIFDALVRAIAQLEADGRTTLSAGVSARMRYQLPGFSLDRTEFKTFREITEAAAKLGLVEVTKGASDVIVKLRPEADGGHREGDTLRHDLWRALLDWSEDRQYVFDPATRETSPSTSDTSGGAVSVPSVSREERLEWMRSFAAAQRDEVRDALEEALGSDDPIAGFHRATNAAQVTKRRWNKFLRERVLSTANEWAAKSGLEVGALYLPREAARRQQQPQRATAPALPGGSDGATAVDDGVLRGQILSLLATLPLHELLQLRIPISYSLRR